LTNPIGGPDLPDGLFCRSIRASTSARRTSSSLFLHQPQRQHLGLDLDVISIGLTMWRLPPLAPQVSQVGNAALVEGEAITLPPDYAFGFELADTSGCNRGAAPVPTR